MKRLAVLLLCGVPLLCADDPHIGTIDFYGYAGLDLQKLRAALPFHLGDPVPSNTTRNAAKAAYAQAIGRGPVEFTVICCEPDGKSALFVGMHEPGAPLAKINPEPQGSVMLPLDAIKLYDDVETAGGKAVRNGHAGEDDSKGYALSEDPVEHSLQLKLRAYALANTDTILRVLAESRAPKHRQAAAHAAGYADASPRQVAALVHASFDPDDGVRNNSIRALGVLLEAFPKLAADIPVRPYIAMLHSADWFDRNKTLFLLDPMTRSRDPKLLAQLRAQALTPLREMAQWKSIGHELSAIWILGRIAGLDDAAIFTLSQSHHLDGILK